MHSVRADVAIAIYDGNFALQDFSIKDIDFKASLQDVKLSSHVVKELQCYERSYLTKFIGVGFPSSIKEKCSSLPSRLWLELDVVPISIPVDISDRKYEKTTKNRSCWHEKSLDEQASSMARKCITYASKKRQYITPALQNG